MNTMQKTVVIGTAALVALSFAGRAKAENVSTPKSPPIVAGFTNACARTTLAGNNATRSNKLLSVVELLNFSKNSLTETIFWTDSLGAKGNFTLELTPRDGGWFVAVGEPIGNNARILGAIGNDDRWGLGFSASTTNSLMTFDLRHTLSGETLTGAVDRILDPHTNLSAKYVLNNGTGPASQTFTLGLDHALEKNYQLGISANLFKGLEDANLTTYVTWPSKNGHMRLYFEDIGGNPGCKLVWNYKF
ncbi:Uncharacterised protein [Candidatus Burarchaeum australiense]|nr:Uncharacterised protein [Candidatus Burarchaeum australiense]